MINIIKDLIAFSMLLNFAFSESIIHQNITFIIIFLNKNTFIFTIFFILN